MTIWEAPSGAGSLRYVPTQAASKLTGLTIDTLREWTRRRDLVPPDVRPKGKGSPARFGWQTILTLRIANVLRQRFGLELERHKQALHALQDELQTRSFVDLWGQRAALAPDGNWEFTGSSGDIPDGDLLLIGLDTHLAVLRDGFGLQSNLSAQRELFPVAEAFGGRSNSAPFVSDHARRRSA